MEKSLIRLESVLCVQCFIRREHEEAVMIQLAAASHLLIQSGDTAEREDLLSVL